jgi:hypothetical protein
MFKPNIPKLVFSVNFNALHKITVKRERNLGYFRLNLPNI